MTNLKQKRFVDTDYLKEQLDSTTVEVEGSHIKATETKIGYTTDIEIHGNTVQDASNLADIRSVGDKVEGQELYEIPVLSCGKNLFNHKRYFNTNNTSDLYGYYLANPTEKYMTLSITDKDTSVDISGLYFGFTGNGHNANESAFWVCSNGKPVLGGIRTEKCKYISIFPNTKESINLLNARYHIQLEYGEKATPYEPYQEDKLTILSPTPLEKVGDVADRIICKDGVWGVEKNIDSIVLDGNESNIVLYKSDKTNTLGFRIYKNNILDNNYPAISSMFLYNYSWDDNEHFFVDMNYVNVVINRSRLTTQDVNGFKLWLQSNPITIKQQTNSFVFIPLPHDQQVKLRTFANKTNISFLTEIEGYIKCKVPKSVGGTLESLVEKAKMTDDRLELLENVSEGNNMKYSTDTGIIHCKDTKKGRVNDLAIEGNTMVNYCRDGSKTLTLNGDINEVGTYITTTNAVNSGKVDVMCEGSTIVNLISRFSYNKNLTTLTNTGNVPYLYPLKTNTDYTLVFDIQNINFDSQTEVAIIVRGYLTDGSFTSTSLDGTRVDKNGKVKLLFNEKTKSFKNILIGISSSINSNSPSFTIDNISVFEGDWTDKEIPSYFEGMKSVGQDDENGHNIEIKAQNKNLLDPSTFENFDINIRDIVGLDIRNVKGSVTQDRVLTTVKVKPNTTYTFSVNNVTDTFQTFIGFANSGYIGTKNVVIWSKLPQGNYTTFTTDLDTQHIFINAHSGYELQLEEGETLTNYNLYTSNKKSITLNEPLRGLPNGVKDRIVKMNNKWYIERNCTEIDLSTVTTWASWSDKGNECYGFYRYIKGLKKVVNEKEVNVCCDTLPSVTLLTTIKEGTNIGVHAGNGSDETGGGYIAISVKRSELTSTTSTGLKEWLSEHPTKVVTQLEVPIYEELTVDPTLTTYVDCTHISTNSVIPCDMKVKNSGYSTIIKPSTLYTIALDTNNSGEVKVNLGGAEKTTTNNIVTLTTPSTLVDDSLRISGKGLTSKNVRLLEGNNTNFIPSYFEGLKSSFDEKQGDNHIVEVISNNKNLIEWEDLSLYTPQKNAKVEKTTEGIRAYNRVTGDDRVFLQPFRVRQGSKVTISFDVKVDTEGSSTLFYLSFLDANFNSIITTMFPTKIYTTSFERLTKTFDVGNASYIRIELVCFGTSTGATYKNIMVTESSYSYTPHKSNKIQFSTLAPLRSVGDVSDKLVYKDNKWMIERNCGEVILNGSEDWVYQDATTSANNYIKTEGIKSGTKLICNNFRHELSTSTNHSKECIGYKESSKELVLSILKLRLSKQNVDGTKEWLSNNPTTVVYELAEPYYEEIGEYKNLDSYDEGTTIYANTLIAPKYLSFNLASHMSNIVKDVQDDVSDLKTWRSEVFNSITHKKTFDSGFTTIEDTKEGVIEDVKLEGKTLVNRVYKEFVGYLDIALEIPKISYNTNTRTVVADVEIGKEYTIIKQPSNRFVIAFGDSDEVNSLIYNINSDKNNECIGKVIIEKVVATHKKLFIYTTNENASIPTLILEGDHTQNPPSYFEGLKSVGQSTLEDGADEIVVSSVKGDGNLFNECDFYFADWQCNKPIPNGDGSFTLTPSSTGGVAYVRSKLFNLKVGETYKLDVEILNSTQSTGNNYYVWRGDTTENPYNVNAPFTVYEGSEKVRLAFYVPNGNLNNSVTYRVNFYKYKNKNIPYTPHQADKKRLLFYNTETQTWEKPILRQWDSIEKHSDGKYYYHQRSGEVVLNGSESDWSIYNPSSSANVNTITFEKTIVNKYNQVKTTSLNLICDKYTTISADDSYSKDIEGVADRNSLIRIKMLRSKLSSQDITGFKQWLQANNVTVVYQLAEEKVYECTNIELNSYDGETNVIVDSGAISPITTVSLTSNLPQVAENLKNRVRQLEAELYNYKVNQNLRQLRTSYRSDYANFGVATLNNYSIEPTSIAITPYGYDLFEIFKEVIAQGKDKYDRIELEEYIDFYLMTFVFDFDMVFELFDLLDANEDIIEDEPVEEEPPTEEEEDVVEDTPTILPNLPEDEATPIPLI